jgi:hypothetical protein
MRACAGQPRTALHPDSGIREAILANILLAIGCQAEQQQPGSPGCDPERVHLFLALSRDAVPAHTSCSQEDRAEGGACSVEKFVDFFPKHFVKGVFLQNMENPKMAVQVRVD